MNENSLQEVQSRIFSEVLGFEELPFMAAASLDTNFASAFVDHELLNPLSARTVRRHRRLQRDIALGTAPGTNGRDVKLAVLVQDRSLIEDAAVAQVRAIAKGEVEVIFIGRQKPMWMKRKQRPLKMGSSVSPAGAGYSGTLGFFGRSNSNGKPGIVSNNHVLADVNTYPLGTVIVQQADGDGGRSPGDNIAKLANFIPIQFGGLANAVDAAFAEFDDNPHSYEAVNIYGNGRTAPVTGALDATGNVTVLPGLDVMKTGRTTGHTLGRVRAINVNNYVVNMGAQGLARFDGQLLFEADPGSGTRFSRQGDSGSLITDRTGVPVALLFAGSQTGGQGNLGITAGNPISAVLSQLQVSFI